MKDNYFYLCFIPLILLFFALVYDLYPLWQDKKQILEQEVLLTAKLAQQKPHFYIPTSIFSMQQAAEKLLTVLQANQIEVKQMRVGDEKIYLELQVDFYYLYKFIQILSDLPLVFLDFSYQADKNKNYVFTTELLLLKQGFSAASMALPALIQYPFCQFGRPAGFSELQEKEQLSALSFKSFHMVGYIEQGSKRQAFIALPNHSLFTVNIGDEIGLEKARVIAIHEHDLEVQSANIVHPIKM